MLRQIRPTQLKGERLSNELTDFVNNWNSNLPVDRWWREKNKVNFNSLQHRSISLIDILIELEEFLRLSNAFKEKVNKELKQLKRFDDGSEVPELSMKEIDNFDKLDLSKL